MLKYNSFDLIICSLTPMHLLVLTNVEQERFVPYAILRQKQHIKNEQMNEVLAFVHVLCECENIFVCNGTKHS